MNRRLIVFCGLLLVGAAPLFAQIAKPNSTGVSLGAVYFTVKDPEAHKRIWVDILGAKIVKIGATEILKMPNVFIALSKGEPAAGDGYVDHLSLLVKSLDPLRPKLTAAGVQLGDSRTEAPTFQSVWAQLPDGVRLEFLMPRSGGPDKPAGHHIHFVVPNSQQALSWYVTTFGASMGRRGVFLTANFTAGELDFQGALGTKKGPNGGLAFDRLGFEVRDLEAFVQKLQERGVKIEQPYRKDADGLKTATISDPLGTMIELTEGLAGK